MKLAGKVLCCALVLAMLVSAMSVLPGARADDEIFTSEPVTTAYAGFGYSYQVTTSIEIDSWAVWIDGLQPIWFYINETGAVGTSGMSGAVGTAYAVSIAATADGITHWQNYTLTVISMFTSSPVIAGQEGIEYTYQVTTHEDVVARSITGPDWLTFNGTNLVSGTPPVGAAGEHEIMVSVWTQNGEDLARSNQEYTLTVLQNADLVFTSTPPTTNYAGWGYSYQVTTSIEIDSWAVWIDGLQPIWFYINETGFVSSSGGIGDIGSNHPVSIAATAGGVTYHQNYTLTVISMFSSSPVTTARDDFPYSYLAASKEPAVSWSMQGPDWLSIDGGLVTGTPPIGAAGEHEIMVSVWTQNGEDLARSNQEYTLTVLPNAAYAITSEPVTNATANITYEYQMTCRYTVTDWNITGPEWLSISDSGLISGSAPNGTDGSFNISARVTLTDGSMAWQNYTLAVVRQPYTAEDGMAMAFGMLGFMMLISAIVGIVASARRRY